MVMSAQISADRSVVHLCKGAWSMRVPAGDLPRWLRFYRGLWARGSKGQNLPGAQARHFEEDMDVLSRTIRELNHD